MHPKVMSTQYDAIVIGTGAGGGTLALASGQGRQEHPDSRTRPIHAAGKTELGHITPFSSTTAITPKRPGRTKDGKDLHPQQAYYVGGQTKVYGAAMFRMRAEDFGVIQHKGGISPAWPITYAELEPYYTRAEELFHVHGDLGTAPSVPGGFGSSFDPTEPFHSKHYPYPAFSNEPRMQAIEDDVRKLGINTFPIPLGLKRNEADPARFKVRALRHLRWLSMPGPRQVGCRHQLHSPDHASAQRHADDQLPCDSPAHQCNRDSGHGRRGHSLRSRANRMESSAPARPHAPPFKSGKAATYTAGFFAVCAGAINSAVILLASANDKHPTGLANRSDQVGRNFMYHQADALLAISTAAQRRRVHQDLGHE